MAILVDKNPPVTAIRIDHPPLNVLDLEHLEQLRDALDAAAADPAARLIVIRGTGGRAFSAGMDVKDHTRAQVPAMLDLVHGVIRRLLATRQPTLAVVDGFCFGGGCELATSCDLVLASEESVFATPEITVGCYPPVALARFASQIGYHRAVEMILTGRRYPAREAVSMGLVNRAVPRAQLEQAVVRLQAELLEKSQAVLGIALRGLRDIALQNFSAALERSEQLYLGPLLETEDVEEGVNAFLEKREPEWKHR